MMNLDYPYHFDGRGHTALTDDDDHIRDMIEQFLLTRRGERVNRPDFGSGLFHMVFEPNSPEFAAEQNIQINAGLQQYLGDLIDLTDVVVESQEDTLAVTIRYVVRRTGEEQEWSKSYERLYTNLP